MSQSSSQGKFLDSFESAQKFRETGEKEKFQLKTKHNKKILSLDWNCDGKWLASGSQDNSICLFRVDRNLYQKTQSKDITTHEEYWISQPPANDNEKQQKDTRQMAPIETLSWHPTNADILASGSEDKSVFLWDIRKSPKPYHIIRTTNPITSIKWSQNGYQLGMLDKNNEFMIVDSRKYTEFNKRTIISKVNEFVWSRNNEHILMATKDGTVNIYKTSNLTLIHSFLCHSGVCHSIDIDKMNNEYIITGGADGIVSIWNVKNLCQLYGVSAFHSAITSVRISGDSSILAAISNDDLSVHLSYIENGKMLGNKNVDTFSLKTINDFNNINNNSNINTNVLPNINASIDAISWNPKYPILAIAESCDYPSSRGIGNVTIFGKLS